MKKIINTLVFAVLASAMTIVTAQDWPEEYLGLPGDNLNLYAVMKLFQESETLEGFERALNDENSGINNLDLNGDKYVDYITVSDYVDKNVHTIVLRAVLSKNEYQDVAVFIVNKLGNGRVQIQLIGDEALYGKNYIIEPYYAETPNPGYIGKPVKKVNVHVVTTTYYDLAVWPIVRNIYLPNYIAWRSAWYWGYYPVYWKPWRTYYWHYYYGFHYNLYPVYYKHYRPYSYVRSARYNNFYYNKIRVYSPVVVVNINKGNYKTTYSRPEQRRDGEAFYSKVHPKQVTVIKNTNLVSNEPRRSPESRTIRNSSTANSPGVNRSPNVENKRAGNNTNVRQNAESMRTPATRPVDNSRKRTAEVNTTERAQKAAPVTSDRPVRRVETVNSSGKDNRELNNVRSRTTTMQNSSSQQAKKVQSQTQTRTTRENKSVSETRTQVGKPQNMRSSTTYRPEVNRAPVVKKSQGVSSNEVRKSTEHKTMRQPANARETSVRGTNSDKNSTQKNVNTKKSEIRTPSRR